MIAHSVSHVADSAVLGKVRELVAFGNRNTAELLVYLAEADERRLYLPAGYASMFDYCTGELKLAENAAYRRITAARLARRFPVIFAAVAEGRLHLTAVGMLSTHLGPENADELIGAATHQTRAAIQKLLAERFPQPDVPTLVRAMAQPGRSNQLGPDRVEPPMAFDVAETTPAAGSSSGNSLAPDRVDPPALRPHVTPLAPQRYALQLTMSQEMHDKLRHAQALLSHSVPSGDPAQVLERALDALIARLEKQKFAATDKPRQARRSANPRYIPADVKRRVRERDGFQCTFVGSNGHRCQSRHRLQFHHVDEVARGGKATVPNIYLRCRTHNQYDAECTFGAGFMDAKRLIARSSAADKREATEARAKAVAAAAEAREKLAALFSGHPGATPT